MIILFLDGERVVRADNKRGKIRSIHVSLMSAGSKVWNAHVPVFKSFLVEILLSSHSYTNYLLLNKLQLYILEIVFLCAGAQLQLGTKDDVQPSDQKGLQHGH